MPDTPAATAGPRITVALLPTLHRLHLEPAFAHYDFTVIRRIILAFGPDAICGEVRPIDWQRTAGGTRPGYCGPVEYRQLILPLCRERGIPFHPVDDYPDEPDAGSSERAGPANPGNPKPEPRPVGGGGMPLASVAGPPVPAAWQTAAEVTWQDVTQTFLQWIGRRELGLRAIFDQGGWTLSGPSTGYNSSWTPRKRFVPGQCGTSAWRQTSWTFALPCFVPAPTAALAI
ncbi:hypothetical protein [Thermaerobacter sp. PB12/4term]|uniref:hypothetical protein n=1 Tax=Thermaerobacter sp. PB12/4term TaxID=2293838 RepID=UPI001FAC02A2|nr:hypothetical protein [Thermaerobacter sp. PB12/4term]